MKIHRAFWIKLGQLAALLDQIDESRAILARLERGPTWRKLTYEEQHELTKVRQNLDHIASID